MRLIDYDAAIDRYYAEYKKQDICDGAEDRDFLKRCFDEAETIDAAPVVHGKWIDKGWDGDFSWRIDGRGSCWKVIACSACGENLCGSPKTAYCPHCGAKMDLPEKESTQ